MNKNKQTKIIGIAGGIGSGKSTVTDQLRNKGYQVLDADETARESVMPGEPALIELTNHFGKEILNDNGTLNRRKLAQIAFSDTEKTKKLNAILHKDIDDRLDSKLSDMGNEKVVFISAPLLFEAGLDSKCDETWTVAAADELRIKRTMKRDGLPRSEVVDRMNKQFTENERIKRADHVMNNNGTKEELIEQVENLLKEKEMI